MLKILNHVGASSQEVSLNFGTYGAEAPTGTIPSGARIAAVDDGNSGAHMLFYTKPSGANTNALVERMRILDNGNIGINGVTNTANTLEINGGLTAVGALFRTSGNAQITMSNSYGET